MNTELITALEQKIDKRASRGRKKEPSKKMTQYFINKQKGMTKKDAAISAGYSHSVATDDIEKRDGYKELEKRYYKDILLGQITMDTIAKEHIKNIVQDEDRGAKNKAIEMALGRLEPDKIVENDNSSKVMVVLR